MKTGRFLSTMAITALLAACSNEDFLNEQAPVVVDGNRPTAKVALVFDEANTRLSFEKGEKGWQWYYNDGDSIGALLMDTWDELADGIDHYKFTDYVHTNYPFKRTTKDGVTTWNTPDDAAVCEGNYFFYFPYDKKFTHRGLVGWSVNPVQKNYDPTTGDYFQMQAIKDNQKWLGYKFINATDEGINKINFDFVPLFATPAFKIANNTGMKLKVTKMVVRTSTNDTNDEIDLAGTSRLMATTMMLAPKTAKFGNVNKTWEDKNFTEHTRDMWLHAQRYIGVDGITKEEQIDPVKANGNSLLIDPSTTVHGLSGDFWKTDMELAPTYEYEIQFGDNYIVGAGDYAVGRIVMPGGVYNHNEEETFEVLLFVEKVTSGNGNGEQMVARIDMGKPQTQGGIEGSEWDDVVSDQAHKFLRPDLTQVFMASVDVTALQSYSISDFKVASTERLEWILDQANNNTGAKDVTLRTIGKRVELSKAAFDILKAKPHIRLHIDGYITLPKELPINAINKLYFHYPTGDPTRAKTILNIESKQVKAKEKLVNMVNPSAPYTFDVLESCEIIVAEGGELDTKTNNITIKSKIINAGKVNAADVEGDIENEVTGNFEADNVNGVVKNYGTYLVKVLQKKDVTNKGGNATIANADDELLNEDGTMTLTGKTYKKKVTNNGVMNINGDSEFAYENAAMTEGEQALNNHGTLNINANAIATGMQRRFYNDGTVIIAEGKTVNFSYIKNYLGGKITVKDNAIMITKQNTLGGVVNEIESTIENAGTIHNVNNNGFIKVLDEVSVTNVTSGEGIIDNSAMGDVAYKDGQTCQYIENNISDMTLEQLNDNVKKADANQLIINGGTLKFEDTFSLNGGSITSETRGYFGKGVVLNGVNLEGTIGKYLILYTSTLSIEGVTTINHGELAVLQQNTPGATATVNGELNVSNYGTFRGGNSAKLKLYVPGYVHNSGTIKNIQNYTDCSTAANNHWTGKAAQN